ncbi:MAG: DNA polymerase III subunit beta [Gammaproteobacteria bacterium]|nr:DNA polymerase III subunit beta [Gammaproteobacteria bacterium]
MKLSVQREKILAPLQAVIGVVEKRQTMPILTNVMLVAKDGQLSITATDLEVELVASTEMDVEQEGEITVPGRKLLDIFRALPAEAKVSLTLDGDRLRIRSGRSRFTLSTLPAAEFPVVEDIDAQATFTVSQKDANRLLEKTQFSMAQQDVRYYLNGILLEVAGKTLRAVATDGHRLALCEVKLKKASKGEHQVIVPRKGVLELHRLLGGEGDITLAIGSNHVRAQVGSIRFTSKLIDGRFPDYARVIPTAESSPMTGDREELKQALNRAAILSNEKYRGIRMEVKGNTIRILAHNPEQEEAEEEVQVKYAGADLEIGFNVNYLLDALAAVEGDQVEVGLIDSNSSCLITEPGSKSCKYVVMPMRL